MAMKPTMSSGASADAVMKEVMAAMPKQEVFLKNEQGQLVGTGMRLTDKGTLLAPDKFGVESGSIELGDLLTISEAAGYLAVMNHADGHQYYMVDYDVPKNGPSGVPNYFRLIEAENSFISQPDSSKIINFNPLTFTYTTQLNARTNSFYLTAASAMKNVKIRIFRQDTGTTLKYLPSKAAWENAGVAGYNFVQGENKVDFLDSPLPLSSGIMLTFEIKADSMSLRGSASNIPAIRAMVQRGEVVNLATESQINPEYIRNALVSLQSPNKLPKTAIQDGVFSVNGAYGNVVITAEGINAQSRNPVLDKLSSIDLLPSSLLYSDQSSGLRTTPLSDFVAGILSSDNDQVLRDRLGLGSSSVLDTNVPNGLLQLDSQGKIPASQLEVNLSEVATSGDYNDLINKPEIPTVIYPVTSVNNKTGDISLTASDVGASPTNHNHTVQQVIGLQTALDSKVGIQDEIPYSRLTGTPTIPAAQVNSDWNSTTGVSQILNKPVLFDGDYNSLLNKPTIPTVSYPVTSVNGKTGDVVLSSVDTGSAAAVHNHTVDQVAGLQSILDGKISTGSSIPYSTITGVPSIPSNGSFSFVGLNDTDNTVVNSGYLRWNSTGTSIQYDSTIPYSSISGTPAIPTNTNQLTNGSGFITASQAANASPVQSVNSKTGSVVLTNTDVGAAAASHTHAITDITGLQTALDSKIASGSSIPYTSITGTPSIPSNGSFTLVGLSDTDNTVVNSGYLKWNVTGTSVQYDNTIPYSVLTGTPVIPTNTNQLTNGSGFITSSQAPVQSVNGKTGVVTLTAADVGAASSGSIPSNNSFSFKGLNDTDDTAVANGFLRWNSTGTSVSYITTIPYTAISGTPVLATVATTGSYSDLLNKPTLFDGTWASLTGKPTTLSGYGITDAVSQTALTAYATTTSVNSALSGKFNIPTGTTSQYIRGDGSLATFPTIPTTTSQLTNDSGYITSVPVTSVNSKTGAVVLTSTDTGSAPAAQGTKYYRTNSTQATGVKVKYYSVTSDANGTWTLSLGTDFTELLDVQATAVSTPGITGVRQASLNSFLSTSTTLSGNTWGNTVLVTILVSGTNSLSLTPNTVVRVRVEGIGT